VTAIGKRSMHTPRTATYRRVNSLDKVPVRQIEPAACGLNFVTRQPLPSATVQRIRM